MILLSIWYLLLTTFTSPPDTGTLKLTIENIQSEEGNIMVALYKSKDNFLKEEKVYKSAVLPAQTPRVHFIFEEIPVDEYAIAVFHDKNGDGKMNFKLFVIPKEPYGFSNNLKPRLKKPAFDDARFEVKGNTEMEISLID